MALSGPAVLRIPSVVVTRSSYPSPAPRRRLAALSARADTTAVSARTSALRCIHLDHRIRARNLVTTTLRRAKGAQEPPGTVGSGPGPRPGELGTGPSSGTGSAASVCSGSSGASATPDVGVPAGAASTARTAGSEASRDSAARSPTTSTASTHRHGVGAPLCTPGAAPLGAPGAAPLGAPGAAPHS